MMSPEIITLKAQPYAYGAHTVALAQVGGAAEQGDRNSDQRVAWRALTVPRRTLAAQPKRLAILQARRDADFDGVAIGHCHATLCTAHGIEEIDIKMVAQVLTACVDLSVEPTLAWTAGTATEKL